MAAPPSSLISNASYVARVLLGPDDLRREMLRDAPRLSWMKFVPGWHGSAPVVANERRISRGKGYAAVCWSLCDLLALYDEKNAFVNAMGGALSLAARCLGYAIDRQLAGAGEQRDYADALNDAQQYGIGIAASGFGPALPGDVFYHLAGAPNVRQEDGTAIMRLANDPGRIVALLRVWGNAVPEAAIEPVRAPLD